MREGILSRIDAVIFDMDGLMFDSEPIWTAAWAPTLEEFGVHEVPEGLADACRGTAGENQARILHEYVPSLPDPMAVIDRFFQIGTRMVADNAPEKPGLEPLLEYLDSRHVNMAVASSSVPELIHANLRRFGLEHYFSAIVSGHFLEHPKPAPDVFLITAQKMQVEPERTIVLEDSIAGIQAAHAGGFTPIMVPDMVAPTPEARRLSFAVCKDLNRVRELLKD